MDTPKTQPGELLGLTLDELRQWMESWGERPYRGNQLYHALYVERCWEFSRMTHFSHALRQRLEQDARISLPALGQRFVSQDGTIRYLLRLGDGRSVEAVWMPDGPDGLDPSDFGGGRQTVCLSTQAGCPVDCRFCATAQLGLLRNLTPGEIVGQVLVALENNRGALRPHTNVVFMGQGEPLLNYDATLKAVRLLADPEGINIPLRRITLSTSGILPGIRRLAEEEVRPKLAVSLNATTDEVRTALMPLNQKYPLTELLDACRAYPLRPWERLTFEYVLLRGVNDFAEDARRLVRLLAGIRAKVNLIPWNPAPELPFQRPEEARVANFQQLLRDGGVLAFLRRSRGLDVSAACGQLSLREEGGEAPSPQAAPASSTHRREPPTG